MFNKSVSLLAFFFKEDAVPFRAFYLFFIFLSCASIPAFGLMCVCSRSWFVVMVSSRQARCTEGGRVHTSAAFLHCWNVASLSFPATVMETMMGRHSLSFFCQFHLRFGNLFSLPFCDDGHDKRSECKRAWERLRYLSGTPLDVEMTCVRALCALFVYAHSRAASAMGHSQSRRGGKTKEERASEKKLAVSLFFQS